MTIGGSDSNNVFTQILNDITDVLDNEANDAINDVAKIFGLHDWYSLHVLDFCQGYYEPGPIPNATLSGNSIWKNTTACSNRTALLDWDPKAELQDDLNQRGFSWLNVSTLQWPDEITDNVNELRTGFRATLVCYCIAVALTTLAFLSAITSIFLLGRIFSLFNVVLDALAFLILLIASAAVTAGMREGVNNVNNYGNPVGITAYGSSKLLAITWVATVLMLLTSFVWCFDCIVGRRRRTRGYGNHTTNTTQHRTDDAEQLTMTDLKSSS